MRSGCYHDRNPVKDVVDGIGNPDWGRCHYD